MFGSAILEVIVGLAFVYFVLSVIASHLTELVAGRLGWRGADLEQGIRTLLADPNLADSVWQHALITGLSWKPGRSPSYIPASTFATALLDVLGAAGKNGPPLHTLVNGMPAGSARQALLSIVNSADGDHARTRLGIESWYNAAMDRVTGVYKRRIQSLTLGLAALLTVVLGADTIALVTTMWQDQALRTALSGAAQTATGAGLEDTLNTLSQFDLPFGWVYLPQTAFGWFLKVLGLLVTALAISLGSPFWFDLLKQFTNPRSSGAVPNAAS